MPDTSPWSLTRIQTEIGTLLPLTVFFEFNVDAATSEYCDIIIPETPSVLRPGEAVAGPVLFASADVGSYALILATIGDPTAVTVDQIVHFLRPAKPCPLVARTTPIRFGRSLITTETIIFSPSAPDRLMAQATSTWTIPASQKEN